MRLDFTIANNDIDKSSRSLLVFLALMAFLVFSFTVVKNTIQKTNALSKSIAENQVKTAGLRSKMAILGSLDKNTLSWQLQTIEQVFPSDKPVMNLINSLKNTARENKVSFAGVSLNPGTIKNKPEKAISQEESGQLQNISLAININGTLSNIFNFIDQFKQTAPLASIDTLTINSLSEDKEAMIKAAISMTVYYQGAPVGLGEAEAAITTLDEQEQSLIDELKDYRVYPEVQARESVSGKNNIFSPR